MHTPTTCPLTDLLSLCPVSRECWALQSVVGQSLRPVLAVDVVRVDHPSPTQSHAHQLTPPPAPPATTTSEQPGTHHGSHDAISVGHGIVVCAVFAVSVSRSLPCLCPNRPAHPCAPLCSLLAQTASAPLACSGVHLRHSPTPPPPLSPPPPWRVSSRRSRSAL